MTTQTALIGHSGFLGETLKRQARFDALFRSTDIGGIDGRSFDLVVCVGAPATKWKANQDPVVDKANLDRLVGHLDRVAARRFVLISTIDVFPRAIGVDEESPVEVDPRNAYGTHRYALEQFCRQRFGATVIRLPALFGPGLRKNAVYDLLNDNEVHKLQPLSTFQFYDVHLLWEDVQRILAAGLSLAHVATEPVSLEAVAEQVFHRTLPANAKTPVAHYDYRTRYGSLWGRSDGYCYSADEVLAGLRRFAASEPRRRPA